MLFISVFSTIHILTIFDVAQRKCSNKYKYQRKCVQIEYICRPWDLPKKNKTHTNLNFQTKIDWSSFHHIARKSSSAHYHFSRLMRHLNNLIHTFSGLKLGIQVRYYGINYTDEMELAFFISRTKKVIVWGHFKTINHRRRFTESPYARTHPNL